MSYVYTNQSVDAPVLSEHLVETRYRREENDGIHYTYMIAG